MKTVYVVLAFHAHEPLWDLPAQLLHLTGDPALARVPGPEHWIRKRAEAGRDVYGRLVEVAEALSASVALEATNELLSQVRVHVPRAFERLRAAFQERRVYPLYGHAHHTHAALLTAEEIADEVRLNREYLHEVLGAPEPRHPGAFPTEASVDRATLSGYARAGCEYVVFPHLGASKARFSVDPEGADVTFRPYRARADGGGAPLVALPRHFPISQHIWEPITRMRPEAVRPQGYLLGDYPVFAREYRGEAVRFPIAPEEAADQYAQVLRDAVSECPDGGLLLYVQDLELMDFGEEALELLREGWSRVRGEGLADVRLVTPDDYLDALGLPGRAGLLPEVRFERASWAPEIRPVLRVDGHYPPLGVDAVGGTPVGDLYRRHPFAFWETGRFAAELANWVVAALGVGLDLPRPAGWYDASAYDPARMGPADRAAFLAREVKRACDWGWRPDEGRQVRGFLDLWHLADLGLAALARGEVPRAAAPLDTRVWDGLDAVLTLSIDQRLEYVEPGVLAHLHPLARPEEVRAEAREARRRRAIARAALDAARRAASSLGVKDAPSEGEAGDWEELLVAVREHARQAILATACLMRMWGHVADVPRMITWMYHHQYALFPPRFPAVLERLYPAGDRPRLDYPAPPAAPSPGAEPPPPRPARGGGGAPRTSPPR